MSKYISVEDSARYELDERKGDNATCPFILYANKNYPELKQTHPEWSVRFTKIRKIWYEASKETREHYVQLCQKPFGKSQYYEQLAEEKSNQKENHLVRQFF